MISVVCGVIVIAVIVVTYMCTSMLSNRYKIYSICSVIDSLCVISFCCLLLWNFLIVLYAFLDSMSSNLHKYDEIATFAVAGRQ